MADASLIEPAAAPAAPSAPDPTSVTPPEATAEAPPAESAAAGLPETLIQVPALQALIAGSPAALSFNQGFGNLPEAKEIAKHKDALLAAGIGFYRSLSGDLGVMFNQFHINGKDLQAADKQGKLLDVAPPFTQVNDEVAKSGDQNPILSAQGVPKAFADAKSTLEPPQSASGATPPPTVSANPAGASGPSAATENQLTSARLKALTPGGPTSGMSPGAGRVLNAIYKPVV